MNLNTIHNIRVNITTGLRFDSCLAISISSNQIFSLVKKNRSIS